MKVQGKLVSNYSEKREIYEVRKLVFVEELGIDMDKVFDHKDQEAIHAVVYLEENEKEAKEHIKAVATGRLYFDGEICELDQVSVLRDYRRKKYGDLVVRMLINKGFQAGIKEIIAYVPTHLFQFFEKIGFQRNNISSDYQEGYDLMRIRPSEIQTLCLK